MAVIDADTHVDECEDTWQYMDGNDAAFRPVTLNPTSELEGPVARGYSRFWMIDGQLQVRRIRDDKRTGTVIEARELHDVAARVRHMDELGVDVHVMYPTLMLLYLTNNPEIEAALFKSYNRWLAAKSSESDGRLRWIAMLPTRTVHEAVEEVKWAKANGACGVLKKPKELGKSVSDPYFFPIYESAETHGLPVCIHVATGEPGRPLLSTSDNLLGNDVIDAFYTLLYHNIPGRFPKLRFGFIEAGSSWIPYVLDRITAHRERMSWAHEFNVKEDLFRESNFFVTCQSNEDVNHILKFGTEDNLMIGTDYTHADASAEMEALHVLQERSGISQEVTRKILDVNPKAFYGL